MQLWNNHPKVYIDVAHHGEGKCPYCGTVYKLKGRGSVCRWALRERSSLIHERCRVFSKNVFTILLALIIQGVKDKNTP